MINDAIITEIRNYYIDNNKPLPKNVVAYLADYPKGWSRQVLKSKLGMQCSELIKLLDPQYEKPKTATERAILEAARLRYEILSDYSLLKTNRDSVILKCIDCGNIHETTITSLQGSVLGCPLCKSGNLPWYKRKQELDGLVLDRLDAVLVSDIPTSNTGSVILKHNVCGTEYSTVLTGITHPQSKLRALCPNCRPTDRRVVYNNITFGSQFELDCYLVLELKNPELHVKYSSYFSTDRRWVCDFKIGAVWIEVSNFKTDYKDYFANIEAKRSLVESNNGVFLFIQSVDDLKSIIDLI